MLSVNNTIISIILQLFIVVLIKNIQKRLFNLFVGILNRLANDRVFVGRCGHQNLRMHCRSIK